MPCVVPVAAKVSLPPSASSSPSGKGSYPCQLERRIFMGEALRVPPEYKISLKAILNVEKVST